MCDRNDSPNDDNYKSTPPTNRKVRNPFDRVLIERLQYPICSPGMCKIYKRTNSGSFRWDIDQACTLVPADIVVCNSQFEPSPDPAMERIAEEATEKFFSQEMVIPSPLEPSKKVKSLQVSSDSSSLVKEAVVTREVSAQTVLTLPPELPPEVEKVLQSFCTFTHDQNVSGEYEITANGSLCRKLYFEEHSDMEHYDSEQTDDEHVEPRPPSNCKPHTPVAFSPDILSRDLVKKGMNRTFGTPIREEGSTKAIRNKILDHIDLGEPCLSPIEFHTPRREQDTATTSSLASVSISPVTKVTSSDEEKNNFTSPESEAMATCLDCIESKPDREEKGPCFCKKTPKKSLLKRSTSLKESPLKDSPPRSRNASFSFAQKRSLSMSSLNRSKSVQKLDFSMDMSIDRSFDDHSQADSESSPPNKNKDTVTPEDTWSIVEESSIQHLLKTESFDTEVFKPSTIAKLHANCLEDTPVKSKDRSVVLSHEISKIRAPAALTPLNMSLDNSLDNIDNPLSLEDKKVDFSNVDLKFLTDNVTNFECTDNASKVGDSSNSFKRLDSGFTENTFYVNASNYYESAIKPSELTVTNVSKFNSSKTALKEISNVAWMRVDSGFKDENSADSMHFYNIDESSLKTATNFRFSEARLDDKENVATENFDRFLVQATGKNETMSMSDIFTDDMPFNCNFSSTPSKNKARKLHS